MSGTVNDYTARHGESLGVIWSCSRSLPVSLRAPAAFPEKLGPALRVNRIFLGGEFGSRLRFPRRTPSALPRRGFLAGEEGKDGTHFLKRNFVGGKGYRCAGLLLIWPNFAGSGHDT